MAWLSLANYPAISSAKTKILSTKKDGPGCKHRYGHPTERSGEVFSLDILSHRMSVMGSYNN